MTLVQFCLLRNRPPCSMLFLNQSHFVFLFFVSETGLLAFTVSLAAGSVVLMLLVIGVLMYCVRKSRPAKRYLKKSFFSLFSLLFTCSPEDNYKLCVWFYFSGTSNPPPGSLTPCLGRAVRGAVHVLGPHTSASLYLWSRQQPRPASPWLLHRQDHMQERWGPVGRCQRQVPAPERRHVTWRYYFLSS